MSVINRMLRELDRREGLSAPQTGLPPQSVRVVPEGPAGRRWFWRILGALMLVSLVGVAWIAWQPLPQVPKEDALRAAEEAQRKAVQRPVQPAAEPTPESPKPESAKAEQPEKPPAVETLRLVQAIETPVGTPAAAAPRAAPKPAAAPDARAPEGARDPSPAAARAGAESGPPAAQVASAPPAQVASAPPAQLAGAARVERRERPRSPAEQAEAEFRRAAALLNQARVAEAEEAFAAALAADPAHAGARQALVVLALEARRVDEARRLLQEGLSIHPANAQFALALARILAGAGEHAAALGVLEKASGAASSPDFHLLRAGVLVRLARHGEAVQAYHAALRLDPANAQAWVGLGVALEALGKMPEAAEAYRRALAAGQMSAELRDFAEQRVRLLR